MDIDENSLYDLMSQFHTIGDSDYGGLGSREEATLVGYIYGIFTHSRNSEIEIDKEGRKVFRFGRFYYVVWFDDFSQEEDETDETEEEKSDIFEVELESIYDEDDDEDEDDEEDPDDEDELDEDTLLPVAIDGPFTIDEIRNLVKKGII
ncbi:hypothetical protein OXIME_001328 [Oxyplasma meridianum]|uniref:Uncharacterized protein n=1 Tax=Oxyplasma meridianum TaxID=3073602 RepID=A0AAX4NJ19_9ARCH